MSLQFLIIFLILTFLQLYSVTGQYHTINVKGTGNPDLSSNDFWTPESKRRDNNVFSAKTAVPQFCVQGLWALYNETNYGEGRERRAKVWVLKGPACLRSKIYPELKAVRSAQFLGHPEYNNNGIVIFSEPNFLGSKLAIYPDPKAFRIRNKDDAEELTTTTASTTTDASDYLKSTSATTGSSTTTGSTTTPAPIHPIKLGSIVVTGRNTPWIICADSDCSGEFACIDMYQYSDVGYYLNKDVQSTFSQTWPAYVRGIRAAEPGYCETSDGVFEAARLLGKGRQLGGGKGLDRIK